MADDAITGALRRVGIDLPPVVLFSDAADAPMLRNWANWFRRLKAGGVMVSYDQEVVDLAQELGFIASLDQPSPGFNPAVSRRAGIIADLVTAGLDFVLSDIDMVWFSGPRPALLALNVDLAISPGTFRPVEVPEASGFVFCTGFFPCLQHPATIHLMQEAAAMTPSVADGQVATNLIGKRMGAV